MRVFDVVVQVAFLGRANLVAQVAETADLETWLAQLHTVFAAQVEVISAEERLASPEEMAALSGEERATFAYPVCDEG